MNRDFKIGLAIGLVVAVAILLWLATRPAMTARARAFGSPAAVVTRPVFPSAPRTAVIVSDTDSPQAASADVSAPPADVPSDTSLRYHTVKKGDTLSGLSKLYYGSTAKWNKILQTNRSHIKDPNRLQPGTTLLIPG